jgi:uronate dehydrogenase
METEKILITGAAGDIGRRLRVLLKGVYRHLRLSDLKMPADLSADEDFVKADLADPAEVERAVAGRGRARCRRRRRHRASRRFLG